MAVKHQPRRSSLPALDEPALEQAALGYAARYATTRAKLAAYLKRKVRERGWSGASEPPIARIVERLTSLNYVDDRAFALSRAASLGRRGYGERRVRADLRAAGVTTEDAKEAEASSRREAFDAALRYAQRRRLGPYASEAPDRKGREKTIGALLRAGHPLDLARRLADSPPGQVPEPDEE